MSGGVGSDEELARTQVELTQSRADLAQSRSDLAHSRADLEYSRSDLAQSRSDLTKSRSDLAQSQVNLTVANELAVNLQEALQASREIGMAMGILIERHKLTSEQAFDQLRGASSRRNVKLRDVAKEVLYTGELSPVQGAGRSS